MNRNQFLGSICILAGLYLLNRAIGDASNVSLPMWQKLAEIFGGFLIGSVGIVIYKYSKAAQADGMSELAKALSMKVNKKK